MPNQKKSPVLGIRSSIQIHNGVLKRIVVRRQLSKSLDLIHIIHYLTLFKVDAAESLKLSHTESEFKAFEELAKKLEVGTLSMVWQMLHKGLQEVSDTFSPISALEMLLIRIAYTADIPKPNELIEEISQAIEEDKSINPDPEPAPKKTEAVKIDPKIKEIIEFFPGAEVETLDN